MQDKGGWTALMFACNKFNLQAVQLLFAYEKDIRTKRGSTALMSASWEAPKTEV